MAKEPAKTAGGNRRQQLAALENQQKSAQRRRSAGLLVICVVLAAALLSYPIYLVVKDSQASNAALADLGVAADAAGCDPVATHPASGNQNHVADGTKVTYDRTPPDSGPHYASPAPFTKRFYTADDRPAVETLVHNLEHGYTVVWYRDSAPQEDKDALAAIAKTFTSEDYDPNQKFIAAPWTEADGAGLPGRQERGADPLDRRPEQPGRHHASRRASASPAPRSAVRRSSRSCRRTRRPDSPEPNGA